MARSVAEIAAEAEKLRKGGAAEEPDDDVVTEEEEEADVTDKSPPGFLSYEDYIKAGKDPKKYKGEDAYKETHEYLQQIKSLKKDMRETTQAMNAAMDDWKSTERARLKTELETELAQHKADGNVDKALEVKEQLAEIKQEERKGLLPQLPPVIVDYIGENPMIDINSKEFDKDFFEDFKLVYDSEIARLTNGTGKGLSDRQITRALNKAYEEAEDLNKGSKVPVRSPRNDRQGTGRSQNAAPNSKGQSIEVRLKNLKFGDNRNSENNPHPAYATYKKMMENGNKTAAARFAKNMLGDD
jgi:hypothetical protein